MGFFARAIEEEPDERGKVFNWTREKRIWMHLSAFLLFSVLIHGSGFYLFKVVYPSPVRVGPEPDGITVLDSSDPAVRTVLQRLSDRTVFLLPPSSQSDVRVRMGARAVHFTPTFQERDIELMPPPSMSKGPGLIEPLPTGPGTPSDEGTPAPAAGRVVVKLDPDLADRPLAPWSILHDYLNLAESLPFARFSIEIAPGGEVRVHSVETGLGEVEKEELSAVIESTLRFVPTSETEKGWIEVGGG